MSQVISIADTTVKWAEQREIAINYFPQTGSTNDDAKKAASHEGEDWVLYVAAHQTSGRGRGTNTWLDTGNGEGLLSTWSIPVRQSPQAITGPRIGLALFQAANSTWPSLEWSLKAPNDLFLHGHKVAGLLLETLSFGEQHRLLVGLGMNILNHPRRFSEAEHLSKSLNNSLEEGEWFQFLDELRHEMTLALAEIVQPTLSTAACQSLAQALNANSSRPFVIRQVSPQGDLVHDKGRINWKEL
jgi:BirA family biotin operon repressor/biotin-[acetyl-CoA-carboxylase] ligase